MKILSIDGGGIKGIIAAKIICEIESRLAFYASDILDSFDIFAGTSTGGILAAGLTCKHPSIYKPLYTPKDLLNIYLNHGQEIFKKDKWRFTRTLGGILDERYSVKGIERVLEDKLGLSKFGTSLKKTIIPAYNISQDELTVFNSSNLKNSEILTKDILRATSAAPTYFEPKELRHGIYIDGGVVCNNPSVIAYTEALKTVNGMKDMVIVSIGCSNTEPKNIGREAYKWGAAKWARPLLDISLNSGPSLAHKQLRSIQSSVLKNNPKSKSDHYFRIEPFEDTGKMDDASDENMKKLLKIANNTIEEYDSQINEIVELITEQ